MSPVESAFAGLLSPIVLCFVLGAAAVLLRSDLKLPPQIFEGLTIYLMLAIGLKGGVQLREADLAAIAPYAVIALTLSIAIPVWSFLVLHRVMRLSLTDAAALAAHYGSVSAVTFMTALAILDAVGIEYEGFAPALLAIMEAPGILVALGLARLGTPQQRPGAMKRLLAEVVSGKSMLLLVGGLGMGCVVGNSGFAAARPFFVDLFPGALCLFLLELGRLAALGASELRQVGGRIAAFAVGAPLVHGLLGVALGAAADLSLGGTIVLATLAASASYIAAPAAVRTALPEANPALFLTASLAVTFPFNLAIGIPLFVAASRMILP